MIKNLIIIHSFFGFVIFCYLSDSEWTKSSLTSGLASGVFISSLYHTKKNGINSANPLISDASLEKSMNMIGETVSE